MNKRQNGAYEGFFVDFDILENPKLSQTEALICCRIIGFQRRGKLCFMSNAILAKNFRIEERSVKRILRHLCDIGALIKGEENGCRVLRVNHDFFNDEGGDANVTGVTSMTPGGDIQVSKGVTSMSPITHNKNTEEKHTPHTPQGGNELSLIGESKNKDFSEAKPASTKSTSEDEDFDAFWSAYPKCERKSGKADCRTIWKTRKLSAVKDKLMAALEIDKASRGWTKNNGEYIPFPKTWLNKKRYADIEETPKATTTSTAKWSVLTYDDINCGRSAEWDSWDRLGFGAPPSWSVKDLEWIKQNREIIASAKKL